MFSRKDKIDITPCDPQYSVKYIGKTETFLPSGKGCTEIPVQKIWDNSSDEKHLKRVSFLVNSIGIFLEELDNKKTEMKFDIQNISYCSAEQSLHERVFSWIWRDPQTKLLECHAVLCSSREKAQSIAVLMSRAFQIAYKDWKGDKTRKARLKSNSKLQTTPPST